MKIGIMGAMPQEIEIIREQMSNISEVVHGNRQYYCGKINEIDVVLVFSRCGKVAAATTATSLVTEFKVDQIIFTGVAGAVSPDLNIGDIVISDELYQHDIDASPLFPRYEIPLMGVTYFRANSTLIEKAKKACERLFDHPEEAVSTTAFKRFGIHSPKCVVGTITCGDQFITSQAQTETLRANQPKTLAVEMEGAAVAQVCHDYNIPFVVIRTISDRADHEAHIDFPRFIDDIAKHYAEYVIHYIFSAT